MIVAEPLQQRGAGAVARVAHELGGLSAGEIENLWVPPVELEPGDGSQQGAQVRERGLGAGPTATEILDS